MTVSSTDIANRALQLIGTRTTITSLSEESNEAVQINLIYSTVVDWCHALTNWNFARATAVLSSLKSFTGGAPWSTTRPSPPWTNEYALPSDFIAARYLTNSDLNSGSTAFLGQPKRYVISYDGATGGSPATQVTLLCSQSSGILVYTARISDPTLWPAYFERVVVAAIARTVSFALTGSLEVFKMVKGLETDAVVAADYINRLEGLIIDDKTVEWLNATGIPYPAHRFGPNMNMRMPPQFMGQAPNQPQQGGQGGDN